MKKLFLGLILVLSLLALNSKALWAGEVDILVDKLVQKGILTQTEANIILDETKTQVRKELAEQNSDLVPPWVQKMRLNGDFRLRYQLEKRNHNEDSRTRARIRYRVGIETDVIKNVKVGFALASGGSDPRSTNQTFQDTFSHKGINLDQAFAEYTPKPTMKFIGGKFKRDDYLWQTTDTFWDDDIRPEGLSTHLERDLASGLKGFANGGAWVLDENNTTNPFVLMYYGQGGLAWQKDKLDAKVATTYYVFTKVKNYSLDNASCTNSGLAGSAGACTGLLRYNYDSIGGSAEFGVGEPFGLPLPRVAFFGDYNSNVSDAVRASTGWGAGIRAGDIKVDDRKKWQLQWVYKYIGKDAFPDTFPDSDSYTGFTDVQGQVAKLSYGLAKNISIGLNYFDFQRIKASHNDERLLQADLLFKF